MCNAATCLSLWHSAHLITAVHSLAWWLVEARQRKHIQYWLSKSFLSVRNIALKAGHLPMWWDSFWMTNHLSGSRAEK